VTTAANSGKPCGYTKLHLASLITLEWLRLRVAPDSSSFSLILPLNSRFTALIVCMAVHDVAMDGVGPRKSSRLNGRATSKFTESMPGQGAFSSFPIDYAPEKRVRKYATDEERSYAAKKSKMKWYTR
jgi:hypothetical protein